jgi:hypothetical protein
MSKEQLQQMYMDYLQQNGYQPFIDSDGDVDFKAQGFNFYISVDEGDIESFRIVFPAFWEIESDDERIKASDAISYANRTTKVARIYIERNDDVYIDANILLSKPDDFKNHFERMIDLILHI